MGCEGVKDGESRNNTVGPSQENYPVKTKGRTQGLKLTWGRKT